VSREIWFVTGDVLAGSALGVATAVAVRAIVAPGMDMVMAMLAGMAVGTILHLAFGLLLGPLLGFFHVMVPGGVIGMYGGMLFAMRDSMQGHLASSGVGVGAAFGALVVVALYFYDRALRGSGRFARG
jgi:hypothetical protein